MYSYNQWYMFDLEQIRHYLEQLFLNVPELTPSCFLKNLPNCDGPEKPSRSAI